MKDHRQGKPLLSAVILIIALTVRITVYPMIVRSYLLNERMHGRNEFSSRTPSALRYSLLRDAADLCGYAVESLPRLFYRTRRTVRRISCTIREFDPSVIAERLSDLFYEEPTVPMRCYVLDPPEFSFSQSME